jgi:hypothetical protein
MVLSTLFLTVKVPFGAFGELYFGFWFWLEKKQTLKEKFEMFELSVLLRTFRPLKGLKNIILNLFSCHMLEIALFIGNNNQ